MKLTTIIGTAIAAVGLTACGSTVALTISPTLALTVSPTVAPTVASTLAPTVSPTVPATTAPTATPTPTPTPIPTTAPPTDTPSPSPTLGGCGYQPCGTGWNSSTACGGSLTITWVAGEPGQPVVVPETMVIDGNTVDVTRNPFTFGPLTVGDHTFAIGDSGPQPFTISACVPTPELTVTADCAPGRVAWTGTGTGDTLFIGSDTFSVTLPTGTSGTLAAGTYDTEFIDTSDNLIGRDYDHHWRVSQAHTEAFRFICARDRGTTGLIRH